MTHLLGLPLLLAACVGDPDVPEVIEPDRGLEAVATPSAIAGKKVALVVGNERYANATHLTQAPADARNLARTLEGLGFDVALEIDTDKGTLMRALGDFADDMAKAEIGFFYYAGHAVQIADQNYILPIDARMAKPTHADADAVDARLVLNAMDQASSKLNVVVLDACRNNPFERSWTSLGTRTRAFQPGGLATMSAPSDTFLMAFATAPGDVAADNGRYAQELATHLQQPCLNMMEAFGEVSARVSVATEQGQRPWMNSTGNAAFRFYPGGCASEAVAAAAPVAPVAVPVVEPVGDVGATSGAAVGGLGVGGNDAGSLAKPQGDVRGGEPSVGGSLDRAQIARVFRKNNARLRRCYEARLAASPSLAGRVSLGLDIAASGRVAHAQVVGSTLSDRQTEECMVKAARGFVFPASADGQGVDLVYPLDLAPRSLAAGG